MASAANFNFKAWSGAPAAAASSSAACTLSHVFHAGEKFIQHKVLGPFGASESEELGEAMLTQREIDEGGEEFLSRLPYAFVGSLDEHNRPWASMVCGLPGFLSVPDPEQHADLLRVVTPIAPSDPLLHNLQLVPKQAAPPAAAPNNTPSFSSASSSSSSSSSSATNSTTASARASQPYLGMLAIDLAARRRKRLNGRVARFTPLVADTVLPPASSSSSSSSSSASLSSRADEKLEDASSAPGLWQLDVAVDQFFGNCPKYITARTLRLLRDRLPTVGQVHPTARRSKLSAADAKMISKCDFFIIASAALGSRTDRRFGVDVSHRGGRPGFVHVVDSQTLRFPDYSGNNMFLTMGNMHEFPHVGLLFVDFDTGDTIQLTAKSTILHQGHAAFSSLPGAVMAVELSVLDVVFTAGVVPFKSTFHSFSPYDPAVVQQQQPPLLQLPTADEDMLCRADICSTVPLPVPPVPAASAAAAVATSSSVGQNASLSTQIRCVRIAQETKDVSTFTFLLQDEKSADTVRDIVPGQYAVIGFPNAELPNGEMTIRSWTISSHDANARQFSISVKRKPAGKMSAYLHDKLTVGDSLALLAVQGDFHLGAATFPLAPAVREVVFVSGGVGITPGMAMLRGLVRDSASAGFPATEVTVLHSCKDLSDFVFRKEIEDTAAAAASAAASSSSSLAVRVHLALTKATTADAASVHSHSRIHRGRIDAGLLASVLSSLRDPASAAFFVCGPEGMMQTVKSQLAALGVSSRRVVTENFYF